MFELNCDICKDDQNINGNNQKILEDYIFDKTFNLKNKKVIIDNSLIKINMDDNIYKFKIINHIAEGSFGKIYKLYCEEFNVVLALKVERESQDDKIEPLEKDISEFLIENSCNLLKVKYIGKKKMEESEINLYLMELANGDLNHLKIFYKKHCIQKNLYETLKFYRDVAEEIRNQIVCLLKKSSYKYVYTDIKLENILYRCIQEKNKNKIRIFLGDLGSAVPDEDNEYTATYPPWEYRNNKTQGFLNFKNSKQKENTLSWMIGIILLSFVYDDINIFVYDELDKLTELEHNDIITLYISNIYGEIFFDYLNVNPDQRPDINIPLPLIKRQKRTF